VILRVRDGHGGVDLQDFDVEVVAANVLPAIRSAPGGPATVNLPFSYQVLADDAEDPVLSYRLDAAPAGMAIGQNTGTVTWTPTNAQLGTHDVSIAVFDKGGGETGQSFQLDVVAASVNRSPVITSTPRTRIQLSRVYVYEMIVDEPNGDPLAFRFEAAPAGMTLDERGLIEWNPTPGQLGSHVVAVQIEDGRGGLARQEFTIDVGLEHQNSPPVIVSTPPTVAVVGKLTSYKMEGYDPDGDRILWVVSGGPQAAFLEKACRTAFWRPSPWDVIRSPRRVTIVADDLLGGQTRQEFDIHVRATNLGPAILSTPPTTATVAKSLVYEVSADDPEDDPLVFSLNAGPTGMTINPDNGLIQWAPSLGQDGAHDIEIAVEDPFQGIAIQHFTVQVAAAAPGEPPVITSRPPRVARVAHLYTYDVEAEDPDQEVRSYALASGPNGATIDESTGVIQWQPRDGQVGVQSLAVTVSDPGGLVAHQRFSVQVVADNDPPKITSDPPIPAIATAKYRYDVKVTDPEGDQLVYSLAEAPPDMTLDAYGRLEWTPGLAHIDTHRVKVVASDPFGGVALQTFHLPVVADAEPPLVYVELAKNPVQPGEQVWLSVTATDNASLALVVATVDGLPVVLNERGRVLLEHDVVGDYPILVTATDASGNSAEATATLEVYEIGDQTAPVVSITSPISGDVVTTFADILGSVQDDNLLHYTLEFARVGEESYTEIARGTDPIADGVLGTFDPTLLVNDSYVVRLQAVDTTGNRAVDEVVLSVEGQLKLGNFKLTFSDMTIPISGIPITVTRTYDTLQANTSGDLGYGWRMEYRDTRLRTSVPPTGMEGEGVFNPWTWDTRVFITMPGGERESFTFVPRPVRIFTTTVYFLPEFRADRGVFSRLEVEPIPITSKENGFYDYSTGGLPYNPADSMYGGSYKLTSRAGVTYEIDAFGGQLRTVTDQHDNTLTFSAHGITSSTGQEVTFQRDPRGRITAITDPTGNQIHYEYDSRGDLIGCIDREGNQTEFEYRTDPPHYLDRMVDPLGRTGARSQYDDEGRLVRLFNAAGNTVEVTHDEDHLVETTVDALGNSTAYEYDERGNVVGIVDSLNGVTTRTYDASDNLLSETDPRGYTTASTYDSRGLKLTETDPLGNVWYYTRGNLPFALTTTTPLGDTISYNIDDRDRILSRTDAAGNVTRFEYEPHGRGQPASIVDPLGNMRQFMYDALGNLASMVDALGNTTSYTYDENGNRTSETTTVTTPDGVDTLTTSWTYDANGRETSRIDAEGHTTRKEYDALGNWSALIDPLGHRTEFVHDAAGQLIETRYTDGTIEDFVYDAVGRRVSSTDQAARTTHYRYDGLGRLVETIYPDGTPTDLEDNPRARTEYDAAGNIVAQIDENGKRTAFEYDAAGRQTLIRDALGFETHIAYDALGRVSVVTDPLGYATRTFYDERGLVTRSEYSDGTFQSYTLDPRGITVAKEDQAGAITRFEYDAGGQLSSVVDALGHRTKYAYDEAGNVIRAEDANHQVTTSEYDGLGRRTAMILPLGERSATTYDAVGNVTSTTDFNGDQINFEYDDLNRLKAKHYRDGTSVAFTYTPTGRRETMVDARGATSFAYDERDRLVSRTDPDGTQISYTYDPAGNRTSVTTPFGTTSYRFDALNRLETVTDPEQGVTNYSYNAAGDLVHASLPNGNVETREYDTLHRLVYLEHKQSSTDEVLASFRYELDKVGNRLEVKELDGRRIEYAYDEVYRLVGEEIFDPGDVVPSRSIHYEYDDVGNRLLKSDSVEGQTTYAYEENDRMLSETHEGITTRYEYDANGNALRRLDAATDQILAEWKWNYENRLIAVDTDQDGEFEVQNQYDADGIRVSQTVGGDETRFLIDANRGLPQVLLEYTPGGIIKVSYVHGLDLISQHRRAADDSFVPSFYHVDGLGSTRALTDVRGLVTDRYVYDAFGIPLLSVGMTPNAYLFLGEPFDAHFNGYYLRARYMLPELGRFASRDSFEGIMTMPMSQHNFIYAHANPVNLTDPTGTSAIAYISIAMGIVGWGIGFGIGYRMWGYPGAFVGSYVGTVVMGALTLLGLNALSGVFAARAAASTTLAEENALAADVIQQQVRTGNYSMNQLRTSGPDTVAWHLQQNGGQTVTSVVPPLPPLVIFYDEYRRTMRDPDGDVVLGLFRGLCESLSIGSDPMTVTFFRRIINSLDAVGIEPIYNEGRA
jgi:RHS repeat-associated protein